MCRKRSVRSKRKSNIRSSYYLLVIITIVPLSGLGIFFGARTPLCALLIGLSFISLLVGFCANYFAGMISYIIPFMWIFSVILSYKFIFKEKKFNQPKLPIFLGFFTVVFIFDLIHPHNYFQVSDEGIHLAFDAHSTYFASSVLEMLKAEYFSRLKFFSAYPHIWQNYHFFKIWNVTRFDHTQSPSRRVLLTPASVDQSEDHRQKEVCCWPVHRGCVRHFAVSSLSFFASESHGADMVHFKIQ